jgi:histidine triad (HIT) family protein
MTASCAFCSIIAGKAPAEVVAEWPDAIAIKPLKPVTEGHVLVIPKQHVADFTVDPDVSAAVMRVAAEIAKPPANIITSAGAEATQTVLHLHIHIVPRTTDDGFALPWTVTRCAWCPDYHNPSPIHHPNGQVEHAVR